MSIIIFTGYFTEHLKTNSCREGDTATSYCELIEENNSLQWFKDGREITESDRHRILKGGRRHRLTIQHVKLKDKGEYSVMVKNCRRQTFLEVEGKFPFHIVYEILIIYSHKIIIS